MLFLLDTITFIKEEMYLVNKDLNAWRKVYKCECTCVGERRGALVHVYIWEHSQPFVQTRLMDIYHT